MIIESTVSPTEESYQELQQAFEYLNNTLFDQKLPPCIITYQRIKNTYGYHSSKQWTNREGNKTDEIAMNPTYFATRTINETLSTLAHEMVHLWQQYSGSPGRGRYHNKEWAEKMKSIGLQPFNITNEKRETGDRVSHYIIENGRFDKTVTKFIDDGFKISWLDRKIPINIEDEKETAELQKSTGGSRIKYTCPNDHYSVWGKKNINPICGECNEFMIFE